MRHSNDRPGLRLAPETERRLREMFDGQRCCRCGSPAERLSAGQFFCAAHFLRCQSGAAAAGPRVYRSWAAEA